MIANTLSILVLSVSIILLAKRIYLAEQNIEAIKEWLKICGVIDIDKITDEFREWKESESE